MHLSAEQIRAREDAYMRDKQREGIAWGTLEFSYLRRELRADVWDADGNASRSGRLTVAPCDVWQRRADCLVGQRGTTR